MSTPDERSITGRNSTGPGSTGPTDAPCEDDLAWLSVVLAGQTDVEIPAAVSRAITGALRAEQEQREARNDFHPGATPEELDESLGADLDESSAVTPDAGIMLR